MVKILGFLILTITGGFAGLGAVKKLNTKVDFLEEFLKFIFDLKTKIRYQNLLLSEILNDISYTGPLYSYLKKCKNNLTKFRFPLAWENSFCNISSEIGLSSKEEELIKNFGINLGHSDLNGQISHCDYYISTLKPYLENITEEKKTKTKIYLSLGVSAGLALALILF